MALGWKKTPKPDDPRLQGHETTYSGQQGGWVQKKPKPVPGAKKPKK
ncbi:hypothetical protein [Streptomyces sp. STCH 565 A]|nr:hypothetical protein [Streptomyces sp. STCH 565 A]MCM8548908.1 hypothetical protein [Streptomyces sp. STCH 565 A]